MANQISSKR